MDRANPQQKSTFYHFGEFSLDATERLLWRGNNRVPLKPKQFDLLNFFVEHAGRTIKKDELLEAVWPGTYVEENTLARNVSWLRTLLEDSLGGQRVIETVPKVGYRFTSQVTTSHPNEKKLIVEEQTVQYIRGEETITIDGGPTVKHQHKITYPQQAASSRVRLPARMWLVSASILTFVALAGFGFSFYWKNIQQNGSGELNFDKIRIDATREVFDSGVKIQRTDLITFSVAGEYKYGQEVAWTFEGDKNADASNNYVFEKATPWSLVAWIGTETDRSKYFQVSKINSITADRNGTLYFALNKPQNDYTRSSGTLLADIKLKRYAPDERPQIKIGSVIHLQNRHPNVGGYLDAWGNVWSKPEFSKITTEEKFVSTHYDPNRDNGSGSWEVVSADGKAPGEPLAVGDRIHLRNKFTDAGYLDSCGWVEHLPVFEKFQDQKTAIFTTKSPNRDYGSGTWIIRSATEADGNPVLEGDSIALENGFIVVVKGKVYKVGFLSVAGNVKDIPAYSDHDGASLVFSDDRSSDQPLLDIWTITTSNAAVREN